MSATGGALRVAMVGHAFMGAAHAQAWRNAHRFFDLPLTPELVVLGGRDETRTRAAAERLGFAAVQTDWRALVERDDVDLVDICTPGDTHREIALAALAAGKHVMCEKPLANSLDEATEMAAAAGAAPGQLAFCGFSYRRTPALALARRLIAAGRLGEIRHVRAQYLQDWLSDADAPMTWRLDKQRSGSGALGDIGAHSIDTAQWLTGLPITGVSALLHTFVTSRPLAGELSGLGGRGGSDAERGPVTVDDVAAFTARLGEGVVGVFEATRFALGRRNANRIEINGSTGSIGFDFEDNNVLWVYEEDAGDAGFRRVLATEADHPYAGAWWPPGHGLGYEHCFTHQVVDVVQAVAEGGRAQPDFETALGVQRVLDAVERSAADASRWTPIG